MVRFFMLSFPPPPFSKKKKKSQKNNDTQLIHNKQNKGCLGYPCQSLLLFVWVFFFFFFFFFFFVILFVLFLPLFHLSVRSASLIPPHTNLFLLSHLSRLVGYVVCRPALRALSLLLKRKQMIRTSYLKFLAIKKNSGDCTTVATQPRQLHYSNNFSKRKGKKSHILQKKKKENTKRTLYPSIGRIAALCCI